MYFKKWVFLNEEIDWDKIFKLYQSLLIWRKIRMRIFKGGYLRGSRGLGAEQKS